MSDGKERLSLPDLEYALGISAETSHSGMRVLVQAIPTLNLQRERCKPHWMSPASGRMISAT
jgi:hypothetical protein